MTLVLGWKTPRGCLSLLVLLIRSDTENPHWAFSLVVAVTATPPKGALDLACLLRLTPRPN